MVIEARNLAHLERFAEQRYDDRPVSRTELESLLNDAARRAADAETWHLLILDSPTGWTDDARQFVTGKGPRPFRDRLVSVVPFEELSGRFLLDETDERVSAFKEAFSMDLDGPTLERARRFLDRYFELNNSISLETLVEELAIGRKAGIQIVRLLVVEGRFALDVLEDQGIKDLFGGRKGIDRVNLDELKREKIRLEQMERRVSNDVDGVERRKEEMFLKGKDETSSRQRLTYARKIKELDARAKAKRQQLAFFHKHLRIVDGLLQIKENMALLKELKVGSIITDMSVEELTEYVEQATVQGQFEMEKFTGLLESLDGAMNVAQDAEEDPDLTAIVSAMEEAHAAEEAGRPDGVAEAARRVDELLDKDSEDPEEI